MSTDLYEVLGVQADATPEQIRKAYKKRALQTHPDRAPASDKAQAEESFRQVNNAYEVLIDPQKRQSYDRHGAWPPPPEDSPRHSQNNTRSHPFHPTVFTFTDPFEIFNSFFGRTSPLHGPFSFGPPRTFPDSFLAPAGFPFQSDPFGPPRPFNPGVGMGGGVFFGGHDLFMPPTMGGAIFQPQGIGNGGPSASHFSSTSSSYSSRQGAGGGQWVSDSRSTSTINGLTTSVHERIDSSGNVHTTTTHPDGHKTHTINGIPQAPGHIEAPYRRHSNPAEHPRQRHHYHHHHDHSRGRHGRHNTYQVYDKDYSPDYRDSRRPSP